MKDSRSDTHNDYVFIRLINDWEIYGSPSKKSLLFKTISYKPPELELSEEQILGLLKEIDQKG